MSDAPSRRGLFRAVANGLSTEEAPPAGPQIISISDNCLEPKGIACRRCGEACNMAAIRFRPALGGISLLLFDADRCTGCGECISPCPVHAIRLVAKPSKEMNA